MPLLIPSSVNYRAYNCYNQMIYDDQRVELVRDNHLTAITTRVKQEYDQAEILIRYDDSKFCYTYYYSMIMQELSSSKVNVIYTLQKWRHCGALCRCVTVFSATIPCPIQFPLSIILTVLNSSTGRDLGNLCMCSSLSIYKYIYILTSLYFFIASQTDYS